MPEILARGNVGQVDFDERYAHRQQRVAKRYAGVGEGRRIQQDEFDAFAAGRVNAPDQFVFGVALVAFEVVAALSGQLVQARLDIGQRVGAVDFRFALSQQAQVGAIDQKQTCHFLKFSDFKRYLITNRRTFANFSRRRDFSNCPVGDDGAVPALVGRAVEITAANSLSRFPAAWPASAAVEPGQYRCPLIRIQVRSAPAGIRPGALRAVLRYGCPGCACGGP